MSKTPEIVRKVMNFLESNGHKCMMYNISKGCLEWCNKDICIRAKALEDMNERNIKALAFADELKNKGHCCIQYLESYPVQIRWCQQENCIHKH
jgi:hypothetical protein